jgi:hypothetical protein
MDKHSSLFCWSINLEEQVVLNIWFSSLKSLFFGTDFFHDVTTIVIVYTDRASTNGRGIECTRLFYMGLTSAEGQKTEFIK